MTSTLSRGVVFTDESQCRQRLWCHMGELFEDLSAMDEVAQKVEGKGGYMLWSTNISAIILYTVYSQQESPLVCFLGLY